ncbi:hypothetical protein Gpo141_00008336 [Globisporangium polare]
MAPKSAQQTTASAVAAALRRRSERQQTAESSAKWAEPPPKKAPRRSSKTDPTVKPLLFWSPEEVATIVQAWRDCIANPPARPRKTAGGFNARLFKRFLELSGGSSPRVLQSVIAKKQLLNNSYQFILDYNKERTNALAAKASTSTPRKKPAPASSKKSSAKGKSARGRNTRKKKGADSDGDGEESDDGEDNDDAAEDDDGDKVNHWFKLTKTQQKSAAMKMFLTDQRQYALLSMDERTFDSMVEISKLEGKLNIRQTWSDDEVALMFRAWREALNKPTKGKRGPLFTMNSRMYQFMGSFSNGTLRRTKQSVILKKDSMKVSAEFILQYNDKIFEAGAEGSTKKKLATWFSLTQRQQEHIVSRQFPKSGFMYFSESQFNEIRSLVTDTERLAAEAGVRQGVMWTHDESVLLVRAWRDIVDRPRRQLRPNVTIGSCVYERFLTISKGAYSRTERATLLKLESMKNMHTYTTEYNQRHGKKGANKDWFSLEKADRKRIYLEHIRANGMSEDRTKSFTDLDKPMFDAMAKINSKKLPLTAITFSVNKDVEGEHDAGEESDDEGDAGDDGVEAGEDDDEDDSARYEDSESEYDHPAYLKWGKTKAKPAEPDGDETVSDDDDGDDDENTGEEYHGSTTGDESNNRESTSNSFIQVTRDHQPAPPEKESVQISDHEDFREDEAMERSAADKSDDGDEDEEKQPSGSRSRRTNVVVNTTTAPAVSRTEKKRQKATTPSTFSLHELADLAMRVNDEADSADSESDSDANDRSFEADDAPPQQEHVDTEATPTLNSNPEVATLMQILQKQSEQMVHVMRDIRDELKRDREDREEFREEMRIDREERRRCKESRKRDRGSDSEEGPPSKKKSSRRLSVQRDGFVVRL